MKKLQAGNSEQGANHSGQADKEIVPDWSPCQNAAECVESRCHILYNGEGEMKAFVCRAHALLILFDDAVQA